VLGFKVGPAGDTGVTVLGSLIFRFNKTRELELKQFQWKLTV
jgi:hypothetical protein